MNSGLESVQKGLGLAALVAISALAAPMADAAPITYLASGTITSVDGAAAGTLTSVVVGDAWSLTLTIDDSEADIAGCDLGLGPCDYANGYGQLKIGTTVVLDIAASAGGVVEIWNDLVTIDGTTDGTAFYMPGDGSITPTQVDGLFVSGTALSLIFNSSALASASLPGSSAASAADFDGLQQGLLLALSTEEGGGGDLALIGAETTSYAVVPVPAAVWLYGSALGLLGWARRRTVG